MAYCRLMGDEREQTIQECQKRILAKEDEIQTLSSRCRDVEERLSISDKQCMELRQEVSDDCNFSRVSCLDDG